MDDEAEADRGGITALFIGASPDLVDGGVEVGGVEADADEDSIGDATGGSERSRAGSGDPDGNGARVRELGGTVRVDRDGFAVEQRANRACAVLEGGDSGGLDSGETDGSVADSKTEDGAALGVGIGSRDYVDGGDRADGDRRVAGGGVHDQWAEVDRGGLARGEREEHVGVMASELGIGDEGVVPAERFGPHDVSGERIGCGEVEAVESEGW